MMVRRSHSQIGNFHVGTASVNSLIIIKAIDHTTARYINMRPKLRSVHWILRKHVTACDGPTMQSNNDYYYIDAFQNI